MKTRITSFFPSLTFSSSLFRLPLSYLLLPFLTLFVTNVATAQIPSNGLVGYWPFNGNANDESGNGNNGTVNGATLTMDRFGNANSAYSFNGAGNSITLQSGSNIQGNNPRSISFWANFSSGTANTHTVYKGGVNGSGNDFTIWLVVLSDNTYRLQVRRYQNDPVTIQMPVIVNQWIHFCVTYDGTINSNVKIYINGVQQTGITSTGGDNLTYNTLSTTPEFGHMVDQLGVHRYMNGKLDDISIYNRALSPMEVLQLYNTQVSTLQAPCTAFLGDDQTVCSGTSVTLSASGTSLNCQSLPTNLQTGLVGYWPFCGNANDESGNGNNGTVNGATLTTDRFGNANSAYSFDGVNDYIQALGNSNYQLSDNRTISCWIKPENNNSTADHGIFGVALNGHNGYYLYLQSTGKIVALEDNFSGIGPGGSANINSGWSGPASNESVFSNSNNWIFVLATKANGITRIYINGILQDETDLRIPTFGNSNLYFGWTNLWNQFFSGKIDDCLIFNRVLSSVEIQQLYTLGQSTYLWSTGATTASISVTPTQTTTYTCTVTDANGNACTDSVTVFVPQITATNSTICAGQSTTLSVSGINSTATPSACPTLPSNLQTGLVGYWPFCGNANDASGNGNNGTVNGATLTVGRNQSVQSAYSFNNNNISIPNSSALNLGNQISISTWIKISSFPSSGGEEIIAYKQDNFGDQQIGWHLELSDFQNQHLVKFRYKNGISSPQFDINCSWDELILGEFNSIIVVLRQNSSSLYINGVEHLFSLGSTNYPFGNSTSPLFFGQSWAPFDVSQNFHGDIDDFCLYNRALSASEIQQLFTLGQTTYLWSNGATTPTINVSPTTTTTYTCTVTTNGVSCTDTITVVVGNPVASITPNGIVEICQGQSISLTGNGGVSYLWNTGAPTQSISVNTEAVYTVTVTDANGCTDTESQLVKVNQLPNIAANYATICQGQSATLTASGGVNYTWSPSTGLSSTSGSTITASPSINTLYTVTGTGINGCTNTAITAVVVNSLPAATITPATATTFCQGGSVVLNANTGTGLTYQWFNNATAISGATSASYTATTNGSYTVVVTNSSTCSSTSTATVVTVNALPTATITPATATTFCQGGSVVLNANTGTGLSYQWRLNGTNITGATSSSYTVNAIGSYTVVVTNASTCSSTSTAVVITVNALPTATITPASATTFCQGGSVVLNANSGTGLSYQWRLNGNPISGATSASYTATTSGSYTVVVTNASACSSTSTATVVTANALPTATITPATATTFCQGGSVVLNANTGTGLSYQWRLNGNPISGATSSSYTANASGSYTVVVTNASTCSSTSTATVVTVNALPTATITPAAATTFCQGGSVVLNANTGTGLTYQWFNNATAISGATSASYTATTNGSYTVVVTNSSTCSSTSTATVVTVNALPTATITPATATTFCQGGSVVLNANTGTGLSYQWRLNGTNITGATSSSYTVNAIGSYTVVVTNASTCSSTSTATVVTVNALPTATITPATATTFCQGSSVVLNANTGTGLTYQWFNNAIAISGATSASYTATTSGSYTVVVTNASTCSATSTANVVTVNALPTATITPATATTFCQGGSVVLNANTGTGLSYQWFNNAVAIGGATTSSYTATASGTYVVVVTNNLNCSTTSSAINVTAVPNVDYFADSDGDGFGDVTTLISTCVQPQGYVADNTDCDDNDATVNTAATEVCNHIDDDCNGLIDDGITFNTYYADNDGDGFGDANNSIYECSQPAGYVTNNTDCNDNNLNQNAASAEICNGEDDDCDGTIDNGLVFLDYYADNDSDGFGAGAATNSCVDLGAGYVTNNNDCNNVNPSINPNATEICNSIDDNCDGQIDEGITFTTYYQDFDNDGFGTGDAVTSCTNPGAGWVTNNTDCDDTNGNTFPGATELCNTIDDNCDGQTDEGVQTVYFIDNDGDTYGNPSVSILACTQPIGYTPDDTDCNDTDASINPGAEDIGGNGIDENCDGEIDNSIFELNVSIYLYPNPTRSELNIQINNALVGNDMYIFDAVGKLVYKQQLLSTQTTLSMSEYANGNYIFRVGELVKRFEVMK